MASRNARTAAAARSTALAQDAIGYNRRGLLTPPHGSPSQDGACRTAAGPRAANSRPDAGDRALAPHAKAGARNSVLFVGRSSERRLQARARRYESLPWRLQQSQSGLAAALRAGHSGGGGTCLRRRPWRVVDTGESHTERPLLAERCGARADLATGRD